jgi:hypothetical protein
LVVTTEYRWFEYPLSRAGDMAASFVRTASYAGAGIACAWGFAFAIMLPDEDGRVRPALVALGMSGDEASALMTGLDQLWRMSIIPTMILLLLGAICAPIASQITMWAVGKGLVNAARNNAPRTKVPAPHQVEQVVAQNKSPLDNALLVAAWLVGVVSPLMLVTAFTMPHFAPGWWISLTGIALTVLLVQARRALRSRLLPRQEERRREIADHWRTEDEAAAWDAARDHAADTTTTGPAKRSRSIRLATVLNSVGGLSLACSPLGFFAVVLTSYPDARWGPPGTRDLGDRVAPTGQAEHVALIGVWVLSALLIIGLALVILGAIVKTLGVRAERAQLERALESGGAPRPSSAILAHHTRPSGSPAGELLAAVAGAGLIIGSTVVILAGTDTDLEVYRGAQEVFAPLRLPGAGILVFSVLCLVAAFFFHAHADRVGRDFRNKLMARWPTLPRRRTTGSSDTQRVVKASVGPALTPGGQPKPESEEEDQA